MKNKKFFAGMLALMFALLVAGCDNGSTGGGNSTPGGNENPFIGTWRSAGGEFTFYADLTFHTITGGPHGTYTYSGNKATLRQDGYTYPIEIGDDGSFTYLSGKYKKQ
jgi:hypothetical protein